MPIEPKVMPEEIQRAYKDAKAGFNGIFLLSCVFNLMLFAGPLYMLQVYDRVLSSRSLETLTVLTLLLMLVFAAQAWFDAARSRLIGRIGEVMDHHLAAPSLRALVRFSAAGLSQAKANQPISDLEQLRGFIAGPGPTVFADLPWAPLFLIACFIIHPMIGCLVLLGAGVLVLIGISTERSARRLEAARAQRHQGRTKLAEAIRRNAESATALGMEGALETRMDRLSGKGLDELRADADRAARLIAASRAIRLALQSGVLGLGAWLVIGGDMLAGAMIVASLLAGRALQPAEAAITHWSSFVGARQALARLKVAMALTPKSLERMALRTPAATLELEGVSAIAPSGKAVLSGLTFSLEAGDTLGVIGKSGSGKTSLARVLTGIWPAARGRLTLDQAEIAQRNRADLGQSTGYLAQEVGLFEGTIAENIARMGAVDAEAVLEAAKAAGAHEMILALPGGYDHPLTDGGASLSSGQRQRIGLARALFGAPFLVVLDEPNANLDTQGEAALGDALRQLSARKAITIVMTHRQSVLAACNKLLVLEDGRQAAFGARDEVLAVLRANQAAVVPMRRKQIGSQP